MPAKSQFISLREAQSPFFVGIDLGGTNIKVGVVDDWGRPLSWLSLPTEAEKGPEDAARRMGEAVLKAIKKAKLQKHDISRVGLGSPGTMDIPAGMLVNPVNLKGWDNFPIRDRVSFHCGLPVAFQNDANAAAYGEFWAGAGKEYHSLVLFTLGTGIGCGIIIGDLIVDGENSHGAECGHIIIDSSDDARLCGCGQRGHLEAYASATALMKRAEELLAEGHPSSLARRFARAKPQNRNTKLIFEEAEKGDKLANQLVMEAARWLGIGTVNLLHTIDPSIVLLGGAMTFGGKATKTGKRFLDAVTREVKQRAFPTIAQRVKIDFASLGGDAGFIGAAGIARLEHRQEA